MSDLLKLTKLKEAIYEYVRVKIELFKLDLTEHLSNILAQLIAYVVILLLAGLVVTFLSMGVANLINERMESNYLGQLVVALFYLLILLLTLFYLRSGKLKKFFESKLKEAVVDKSEKENLDVK